MCKKRMQVRMRFQKILNAGDIAQAGSGKMHAAVPGP